METSPVVPRFWYKKKPFIAVLSVVIGVIVIANLGNSNSSVQPSTQVAAPVVSQYVSKQTVPPQTSTVNKVPNAGSPADSSNLSNNNYYTNTYGNKVHSPAYSNSIPSGASAQCRDGTYSFSQSRRGTCSGHGGVANWL